MDRFSLNHVKVFVNLDVVDENVGPTYVLPRSETRYCLSHPVKARLRRKDQRIKNQKGGLNISTDDFHAVSSAVTSSCGDKGSALVVNTGVCLHCGSNNASKDTRKILLLHYCIWDRYVERQNKSLRLGIKTRYL